MTERKEPPVSDQELFRQTLEGVVPLPPSGRVVHAPTPQRMQPGQRAPAPPADNALSDHRTSDEPLDEFMRNGVSRMTLRKLRRGQWPVQDALDLHGLNSDAARQLLGEFLQQATRRRLQCVCVIHGKGWHSQGGEGVLRSRSRHWLTQCQEVLAFCDAPPYAGNGGAVWVLLKVAPA